MFPPKENSMDRLRQRLAQEEGFTLIELLVVIVIIGILLAIAVPSYLGFRDRAAYKTAESDIRAALPSVEAYYGDNGTYTTMTVAWPEADRPGPQPGRLASSETPAATYCLNATVNGKDVAYSGPGVALPWFKRG